MAIGNPFAITEAAGTWGAPTPGRNNSRRGFIPLR